MTLSNPEPWDEQFARFARLRGVLLTQAESSRGLRVASSPVGGGEGLIIWGQGCKLNSVKYHNLIILEIHKWCEFEGDRWEAQKQIFSELLSRFFEDCGPCPGWITVLSNRVIYRHRLDENIRLNQTQSLPTVRDSGRKLQTQRLSFGGLQLPRGLVMATRQDRPIRDTQIVDQTVTRELSIKAIAKTYIVRESFVFLSALSDLRERAGIALGRVPAVEQFYDETKRILFSLIISLVKMSMTGLSVEILCFNLNPTDGKSLDFRFLQPRFNYYVYSGANSYDLLTQVVSRGCWCKI